MTPASMDRDVARAPGRRRIGSVIAVIAALAVLLQPAPADRIRAQEVDLRIIGAAPATWDPALVGDAGSASTLTQVFEGVTAFDAQGNVQPALADGWRVEDDGRRVIFQLRSGVRFSDGTPITAQHVADSWLRLLDPARPSPLVTLLADVVGATEYLHGTAPREAVGLTAAGDQLTVDLRRPATYFLAATASPSLAVVPPGFPEEAAAPAVPDGLVVSGAYRPVSQTDELIVLDGNATYWAGQPPLDSIEVVTDVTSGTIVEAFTEGQVDYAPVAPHEASWIRYDRALGPQLRSTDALSVHYFGFDATQPPFHDARVRRAFALAADWDRMVAVDFTGQERATSLVPEGVPGRPEGDFTPAYDPDVARRLLTDAGFPDGEGFPEVALVSFGYGYEETAADEIERTLGVTIGVEIMPFEDFTARLEGQHRPAFWTLTWIADYPQPHDFLGLLLESGSASNEGGWSNAAFDATLEAAAATTDLAEQARHYADAERIVADEAPVIPVEYGESWALSRTGLLGALESGMGFLRYAGLTWAEGAGR